MAGSAMLAIAVSSEAIASAVKIAAIAQRRRSAGKPSETVRSGSRAAAGNVIVIALRVLRQRGSNVCPACTTPNAASTGIWLHAVYARRSDDRAGRWRMIAQQLQFQGSHAYR